MNEIWKRNREKLLARMRSVGQPWAVSSLAQAAGLAALEQGDYVARVRTLIETERPYLLTGLRALGLRVIEGKANYLLFRADAALGERLERLGARLLRFWLLLFRLFLLLREKLPPVLWVVLCRIHRCVAFPHLDGLPIRGKPLFGVALGNMDFFTRGLIVQHRAVAGHALGELIAGLKFFQWVSPPIRSRAREQNSVFSSMPM